MELRPTQAYAIDEAERLIEAGVQSFCITSPTGGGKTLIELKLAERARRAVMYHNRVILGEQMFDNLARYGMDFGIQAAGYAPSDVENIQVASIQTVSSRVRKGEMNLPEADRVFIDEAHSETGPRARYLIDRHKAAGATIIGLTATPLGLADIYDELVVAGVMSDLIRSNALVPAYTFAPDEISMNSYKDKTKAVLELKDGVREVMLPTIFGRVHQHIPMYNPELKPAVLFAPDVAASQWFAERLWAMNIPAAHIDSSRIWINGETIKADREGRNILREASITRRVRIVCNRFVLRTGVDWPHLYHGILACTFGGAGAYIQAGGRLLRQHFVDGVPQLDHVVVQDHGGNYWRHDSLNADRIWSLDTTEKQIQDERFELFRTKKQAEPFSCPQCHKVRTTGIKCPRCGFICKTKKRMVIETTGKLVEVTGDILKPRRIATPDETMKKDWMACVCRCRATGKTMGQARGLFMVEHGGLEPSNEFPMYPKYVGDWARLASELFPDKRRAAKLKAEEPSLFE